MSERKVITKILRISLRHAVGVTIPKKPYKKPLLFADADTGNEIIFFVRTVYRWTDTIPLKVPLRLIYLRDPKTKRFIKRLYEVEHRLFMVVDYSEDEAKKGNPLYVDAVTKTAHDTDTIEHWESYESLLEKGCIKQIIKLFGKHVAYELLDLAGVEYGSKVTTTQKASNDRYEWWVVWMHRKGQEPKSETGADAF